MGIGHDKNDFFSNFESFAEEGMKNYWGMTKWGHGTQVYGNLNFFLMFLVNYMIFYNFKKNDIKIAWIIRRN